MKGKTSLDTLVEHFTGLLGGVDIAHILALHISILVVQHGLDHTIPNSFADNILCRLFAVQAEPQTDVAQGNAGVREGHHADTGLDDILAEAKDQGIGTVAVERHAVCLDDLLETLEIANTDGLDQQKVRMHGAFECRLPEDGSVGDVSHQQLHHDQQLHGCLVEAARMVRRRRFAGRSNEVLVGFGILELDGADATEIVEITRDLVVGRVWREFGVRNKEVGLGDVGSREIVAKKQVGDGCLDIDVLAQHRRPERAEERMPDRDDGSCWRRRSRLYLLEEHGVVKVDSRSQGIQGPAVVTSQSLDESRRKVGALLDIVLVEQIDLDQDSDVYANLWQDVLVL
jgi:hypothetical protein